MARQNDATKLQNKLETVSAEIDAIKTLQEEIKACDRIGDTVLSGLFHEARTGSGRHWNQVTAFCNIERGELIVDHTDKISDGRWSPDTRRRFDVLVTVRVQPFMPTQEFKFAVDSDLQQAIQARMETKSGIERQLNHSE